MTAPNKQLTNGGAPDIQTMLAASSADDGAPLPSMLARAMVYSQDADRKLDRARAMKQEAAKYRDEVQRQTLEQTEAFSAEARAKAEADYDDARKLRADAEETYDAARAELARAATVRADADAYAASARTEADDHADGVRSDASTYAGVHGLCNITRMALGTACSVAGVWPMRSPSAHSSSESLESMCNLLVRMI